MSDKKKPNGAVDQSPISAMSDKKKPNGVNGDLVAFTGTSKGAKFADKLNKIFGLCSELKNDSIGAVDFEKTLEENAALKAALKKREDELKNLNGKLVQLEHTIRTNLNAFGQEYAEYDTRLKVLTSVNEELKETKLRFAKSSKETKAIEAENRQLKKGATDAEAARKKVETKLAAKERECLRLDAELAHAQETIYFYGEKTLVDVDHLDLETKFDDFTNQCHELVMSCFQSCEVPPSDINALEAHISDRGSKIPLSQSTTLPARLIRAAAAEAVIMSAITAHIFTEIYLPGRVASRKTDVSATLDLFRDARREALVRCQLLAEFSPDAEIISSVKQAAFNVIWAALGSLPPAGKYQDAFHTGLAGLLQFALEIWTPLQASKRKVLVDFLLTLPDLDRQEDYYADFDKSSTGTAITQPSSPGATRTSPVLMLFPLILMEDEVLADPKALWSDQAALIEAKEEAAGAVGVADVSRHSSHQRRQSFSGRPGGGSRPSVAAGSSSTAPPAAMSDFAVTKLGSPGLGRRVENGVRAGAGK